MSVVAQRVRISKAQSRREFGEDAEAASARRNKAGHHGRRTSCDRFFFQSKLRGAWAEFLGCLPWDVFATLTFKRPTGEEVLVRNIGRWLWLWQLKTAIDCEMAWLEDDGGHDPFKPPQSRDTHARRARGPWPNAYRKGRCYAQWVAGIEPHKSGRLHAHVMIHWSDRLKDLTRTDGWRIWFDQYGFARIESPRSELDVAAYCTKYVVKGGDLYLSKSLDAYKPLTREPFSPAEVTRRLCQDDASSLP